MGRRVLLSVAAAALLAASCAGSEVRTATITPATVELTEPAEPAAVASRAADVEPVRDSAGDPTPVATPVSPPTSTATAGSSTATPDDRGIRAADLGRRATPDPLATFLPEGDEPAPTPTAAEPTPTSVAATATAVATAEATPATETPTATPTVTAEVVVGGSGASTPTVTPTPTASPAVPASTSTPTPEPPPPVPTPTASVAAGTYFTTLPVGSPLPGDASCAAAVRADPRPETNPANATANATAGGPSVLIDGAHGFRNDALAARITGNFTGTTEELIRWAACKWGFDEELTRARVWTESSWNVGTQGDRTSDGAICALIGLGAPCFQSYGLLQVKGTVHEGTYPSSFRSSAWGLDYAMAWQRACFEGAFTWLDDQGYRAGDVNGCVGAWFSGEWYDGGALGYLADVEANRVNRPWA